MVFWVHLTRRLTLRLSSAIFDLEMAEPDIHDRILLSVERVLVLRKERDEAESRLAAATREYRDLVDSIGAAAPESQGMAPANGLAAKAEPEADRLTHEALADRPPKPTAVKFLQTFAPPDSAKPAPYTAVAKVVDGSVIPSATTGVSIRAALHGFFAAQTVPVTQAAVIGLMDAKGFDRKSVETALYDMTSPRKIGTLDRTSTGLVLNAQGRAATAKA